MYNLTPVERLLQLNVDEQAQKFDKSFNDLRLKFNTETELTVQIITGKINDQIGHLGKNHLSCLAKGSTLLLSKGQKSTYLSYRMLLVLRNQRNACQEHEHKSWTILIHG
jgi:hypothetical protein